MDEVIEGLFIGPKECAELSQLCDCGVSAVVSIGCPDPRLVVEEKELVTRDDRDFLCFPDILDTPETLIVHILSRTSEFISLKRKQGRSVLVHCVHGQSRSAVVVVSYLVSIGHSLSEALILLKSKRDSICINPGFLTQLLIYCNRLLFPNEAALLLYKGLLSESMKQSSSEGQVLIQKMYSVCNHQGEDIDTTRSIVCSKCEFELGHRHSIMERKKSLFDEVFPKFIKKFLDHFWDGHPTVRDCAHYTYSDRDFVCVEPLPWMIEQCLVKHDENIIAESKKSTGSSNNEVLPDENIVLKSPLGCLASDTIVCCPRCHVECGFVRCDGLPLKYVTVDLFVLRRRSYRLKRIKISK